MHKNATRHWDEIDEEMERQADAMKRGMRSAGQQRPATSTGLKKEQLKPARTSK